MGNLILDYANEFFDKYMDRIGKLLIRFYRASSIAEVQEAIPHDVDQNAREVITTRWPFLQQHEDMQLKKLKVDSHHVTFLRLLFRCSITASKEDWMPIQNK